MVSIPKPDFHHGLLGPQQQAFESARGSSSSYGQKQLSLGNAHEVVCVTLQCTEFLVHPLLVGAPLHIDLLRKLGEPQRKFLLLAPFALRDQNFDLPTLKRRTCGPRGIGQARCVPWA